MPAHLRPLDRCRTCGKPATEVLMNTHNAECGVYCSRHAPAALREFRRLYEREGVDRG